MGQRHSVDYQKLKLKVGKYSHLGNVESLVINKENQASAMIHNFPTLSFLSIPYLSDSNKYVLVLFHIPLKISNNEVFL